MFYEHLEECSPFLSHEVRHYVLNAPAPEAMGIHVLLSLTYHQSEKS